MDTIICHNSESIQSIKLKNENTIIIFYRKPANKGYEYNIKKNYWEELIEFNNENKGLGINRKINEYLKFGIITKTT
jgi:hypothetical protein